MTHRVLSALGALLLFPGFAWSQAAAGKPTVDALGRSNPRSSVTGFLVACHNDDYARASQYLDLRHVPESRRVVQGPQLAKHLEEILNSDSRFDVLRLSQSTSGDLTDDPDPSLEQIATVSSHGKPEPIQLARVELTPGSPVWIFSQATVALIPSIQATTTDSAIEARLPQTLVTITLLETQLWKWIALFLAAVILLSLYRLAGQLLGKALKHIDSSGKMARRWLWVESLLLPCLVLLCTITFGIVEQFIDPSALSRLYIGRFILLVVVWSFAWCFVNVVDLTLARVDRMLDPRQRVVSHSLIYLGRRTAKAIIFVAASIIVLDNWGYNMTTVIAGLGVGGIAVALAAQNTIANVFGGVSVIGDHPVMVGDFGSFGGVIGTVEDIGMRSTRVRTLNRTLMSIPNSVFAGMNLENYALRDKILFNPTLQVKRGTPKEKVQDLMAAIEALLKEDKRLQVGATPLRLISLSTASLGLEIFAYALTSDMDDYHRIQSDLYLEIDDALATHGVELA